MAEPISTADKIHAASDALEVVKENVLEPLLRAATDPIGGDHFHRILEKVNTALRLIRTIDEKELEYLERSAARLEEQRENIRKRL
jgi:hypothetical protein